MTFLFLDAGHGGVDSGAIALDGTKEKDVNLKMTMYMFNRFNQIGIKTGVTRSKDITLDSNDRTRIVRNSGAKYCLSIHFNAGGGDGFEAIHSKFASRKLADTIADEVKAIGQNVRRVFTRTLSNGRDYYFMNRETGNVETVILEGFFGDNLKDYEDYNEWHEQVALCEAYIKGFCNHVNHKYTPPTKEEVFYRVVTGSFSDIENAEKRADELKKKGFDSFIDIYKK